MRKEYGDHRGVRTYANTVILSLVRGGGQVFYRHFRRPQDRVWIRWLDGTTSCLYAGKALSLRYVESQEFLRRINMAIAKRSGLKIYAGETTAPEPCPVGKEYPTLVSFITDVTFEDGEARTPGSITIFRAQEGGLRLCLNDKGTEESAFLAGGSITDLFRAAEEGLLFQSLDWRTQKKWKGKK